MVRTSRTTFTRSAWLLLKCSTMVSLSSCTCPATSMPLQKQRKDWEQQKTSAKSVYTISAWMTVTGMTG